MAEAICDTPPIQYLYQLGLLDLLPTFFRRVTIPEAVAAEIVEGQRIGVPLPEVRNLDWVDVRAVSIPSLLRLVPDLGPGEREALALALERPGAILITDDRLARQLAPKLRIPVTGTLGLLVRAKRAGHIGPVSPFVDRLDALGFRLDPDTRRAVLHLAGE